jgi:hypothetical protein
MKIFLSIGVLSLFWLGTGCGSKRSTTSTESLFGNAEVDSVRNSALSGYTATTVGKAFEGTFSKAHWSSLVTRKGVTVVEFDGTISGADLKKHFPGQISRYERAHPEDIGKSCPALTQQQAEAESAERDFKVIYADYNSRWPAIQEQQRQAVGHGNQEAANAAAKAQSDLYRPVVEAGNKASAARRAENELQVSCVKKWTDAVTIPVNFQFTLSADRQSFELTYAADDVFGNNRDRLLDFIYH